MDGEWNVRKWVIYVFPGVVDTDSLFITGAPSLRFAFVWSGQTVFVVGVFYVVFLEREKDTYCNDRLRRVVFRDVWVVRRD